MASQLDLLLEPQEAFKPAAVATAINDLAHQHDVEALGAVFTKREVAEFMLDMAGYTPDQPLHQIRLLEPSFGAGDFLLPAVKRLLASWRQFGVEGRLADQLGHAIRAVELHRGTFEATRNRLLAQLTEAGVASQAATTLADQWLIHGDFLLEPLPECFDCVIGNPPYVRQELIPEVLLKEYRSRYRTLYDRADLYVPFIERSLLALKEGGQLAFICADRWMKNRYGGPLRAMIAADFHLKAFVDMVDTPAFQSEVIAYPAIVLIERASPGPTRIAKRPAIDKATLEPLARSLREGRTAAATVPIHEASEVLSGSEPWLLELSDSVALLRRLEESFPLLEDTGCRVGIGVATGSDADFIAPFDSLDVETDRKLPLVMTRDIDSGELQWRGYGVINPFAENGRLVDLDAYPRLARYLNSRKHRIAKRHCAQKAPSNWYRTIDRIWPALTTEPKLLIPDIKGEPHIVFDKGAFYPHHNLYFVTSDRWDLRALQAVLRSRIARLFVASYSTKMRGGYLRFQAQYLRRIRLPHWDAVSPELRGRLTEAARQSDLQACNSAASELYGISESEASVLLPEA